MERERYIRNKKKMVGFIAEDMAADFTKELIRSLTNALSQIQDTGLVVIVGKHDDGEDDQDREHLYRMTYNAIYQIGKMCCMDGLILSMGGEREIHKWQEKSGGKNGQERIPEVYIASDIRDETVVNYDNESGIHEAVNCLINVNGVTRICMLGGRDDNADAQERKNVFIRCLESNGIAFSEAVYEKTDMSAACGAACERLLERNPNAQAVFCVNDAVAKGLYGVMKKRGMVPGKDLLVFGFDNTRMAGSLIPPLASIGCDTKALGQKAAELLVDKINGREVSSACLPTRLYGRESFRYDSYDYSSLEMMQADEKFIYRMFDDCFYRYKSQLMDEDSINLRRLFYEFISRMLHAMKRRYMDADEFEEIGRMIDIFFKKGALEYTDAFKLLESIDKLQTGMNAVQRSAIANVKNNRLFLRMKDRAIVTQAESRIRESEAAFRGRERLHYFLVYSTDPQISGAERTERILDHFYCLGLENAALCLYDAPVRYTASAGAVFPEKVNICCMMKSGELYILPEERRPCTHPDLFQRLHTSLKCRSYVIYPVFFLNEIYGIMVCEMDEEIIDQGEYIAEQVGRVMGNGKAAGKQGL